MNKPFPDADEQLTVKNSQPDQHEKDTARFGNRVVNLRRKLNNQHPYPMRPLKRVEIDGTQLDLSIVDEKKALHLGRFWLTLKICRVTGVVVSCELASPQRHQGPQV